MLSGCDNHEDVQSRHLVSDGKNGLKELCCKCWLALGKNPSRHHECV